LASQDKKTALSSADYHLQIISSDLDSQRNEFPS
jgi:hypothetical protein